MARMSGAILTKLGLAPTTLTIRIDRRAPPSDREDIADGRELDIAKESRELLLFSCHADVMTNPILPGHCRPGLVRVELPGVEVEEYGLALGKVHSSDSRPGQRHREQAEITAAADGEIQ